MTAAELMGLEELAGTVEVGRWADLIAVEGDRVAGVAPLPDVRFVMKGGVVVADTRPTPPPP